MVALTTGRNGHHLFPLKTKVNKIKNKIETRKRKCEMCNVPCNVI